MEHLSLEEVAEQGVREFAFLLAPLRIVGGTGCRSGHWRR